MTTEEILRIAVRPFLTFSHAGCFLSRGVGTHPDRILDTYELIYVSRGELHMYENDKKFLVNAGESLLLYPHRKHGGLSQYKGDLIFFWLHFSISAAHTKKRNSSSSSSMEQISIPQHTVSSDSERLLWLWRRLLDDMHKSLLTPLAAQSLLYLLLEETARYVPSNNDRDVLAQKIENYIPAHFHEEIGSGEIASKLGYNSNYLSRVYRKVYNRTITTGLHLRRIRYSQNLLLNSDMNINEIVLASDFQDPAQFRKIFRRHTGITPSQYRKLSSQMYINTE